jgi:hypothetical protein
MCPKYHRLLGVPETADILLSSFGRPRDDLHCRLAYLVVPFTLDSRPAQSLTYSVFWQSQTRPLGLHFATIGRFFGRSI